MHLAAEGVVFRYPHAERLAIDGVSFAVEPGERLAIVGPNGAGKSTLLQLLDGLEFPTAGEIRIGNTRVTPSALRQIRGRVGLVFQSPDDQLFCPTVADDLRFGPQQFGWPRAEVEAAVEEIAAQFELTDLLPQSPLQLSQGERQRVALATTLILRPEILLLDEPTASLDPRRRRRLIELLGGLEQTLIVATHDLDLALDLCPRCVILSGGRVIAEGESARLLIDRALLEGSDLELPLRLQGRG
ncbi:ABC transporter ATP-binding protein [Candidatus Sumerlaeota bacterium]|nr:ABC transporter ATP-binding protein [Candidatus Sumerlaeota bacterium]